MTEADNVIRAFSADHVVRLTGLSKSQLRYWDQTGFFRPRYAFENRRVAYSRVYSFRDVVGLRTLAILRRKHKISLQRLRRVAEELSRYDEAPWSEIKLYVLGKEVYFREPETGQMRGVATKQYVEVLVLQSIMNDVAVSSNRLRKRKREQFGRIERHRYIVHNAWVLAGTRIPTRAIWRYHEAGYSTDQIICEYPNLTAKDVRAALRHEENLARGA